MNKLISIIMPTYNRVSTIGSAIESVLEQSYDNWELIIVDDGSTDGTEQLVSKYLGNRIKYFKNSKNMGANCSRNRGILLAKGEYITFLDSDCRYKKSKLKEQIETIELGYDMVFCSFEYYKGAECSIRPIRLEDKKYYDKNLKEILARQNVIDTSTMLIKRTVLERVGLFDEAMPRMQDYELAIRIVKQSKVKYMEAALVENYFSENSISTNHEAFFQAIVQILKKHKDFFGDTDNFFGFMCSGWNYCVDRNLGVSVINHYLDVLQEEMSEDFAEAVRKVNRYVLELYQLRSLLYERNKDLCIAKVREELKNEFVIYGAGKKAMELYDELTKEEKANLKYFVVSQKKEGMNTFCDKQVLSLEEFMNEDENIFILLALNTKNMITVRYILDATKFKNYAVLNI